MGLGQIMKKLAAARRPETIGELKRGGKQLQRLMLTKLGGTEGCRRLMRRDICARGLSVQPEPGMSTRHQLSIWTESGAGQVNSNVDIVAPLFVVIFHAFSIKNVVQ